MIEKYYWVQNLVNIALKNNSLINELSCNFLKAGLLVHGDFIVGLPRKIGETIKMAKNLIWDIKAKFLQITVASQHRVFKRFQSNNYLLRKDTNEYLNEEGYQKAIISYPLLKKEEMVNSGDIMLKKYYLSNTFIKLATYQVLRKNMVQEFKDSFCQQLNS